MDFGHRDPQTLGHLTSSVIALSAVDLGHHDHQTSLHLTYQCTSFLNKVESNTPRSLKDLEHKSELDVAGTVHQTFRKVVKTPVKRVNACLQKSMGLF
jgi:hypothetical protein